MVRIILSIKLALSPSSCSILFCMGGKKCRRTLLNLANLGPLSNSDSLTIANSAQQIGLNSGVYKTIKLIHTLSNQSFQGHMSAKSI